MDVYTDRERERATYVEWMCVRVRAFCEHHTKSVCSQLAWQSVWLIFIIIYVVTTHSVQYLVLCSFKIESLFICSLARLFVGTLIIFSLSLFTYFPFFLQHSSIFKWRNWNDSPLTTSISNKIYSNRVEILGKSRISILLETTKGVRKFDLFIIKTGQI